MRKVFISVFIGFVLLLFLWAIDVVPTGKTQVVTRFGKVVRTNGEGLAFHIPMVERTKSIDTTIRRESAEADAATSNLQAVTTKVALNYRITREDAVKQYQNFTKKDFVGIVVTPRLQDSIKAITPRYTAEELILKRSQVATDIKNLLDQTLGEYGLTIVDVSIENYQFDAAYTKAIATKSVITQETEAAKLDTEKIRIKSDNAILQAQKAAEVRNIEAQQSEVNLRYYELQNQQRIIDKWNGVLPTTSSSNGSPFGVILNK